MIAGDHKEKTVGQGNAAAQPDVFIKKAMAGDQAAFKQLYDQYAGRMYSLCKRYAGPSVETDDLFQEGFLKVYKNLQNFRGEGSFEGWMRRIFVNTCLDFLKKNNPHLITLDVEESPHLHPLTQHTSYDKLLNDELMKIIQRMPAGYRTIVNLHLVEGYSHKEVAHMLGISEGTSKSQLFKAKNRLKELIAKNG